MPTSASSPASRHRSCSANCASPSFTPGCSYGAEGSGSESGSAMSTYAQRASNAAAKICGLKRGAVALTITSASPARAPSTIASTDGASSATEAKRPSSSPQTALSARGGARSAKVMRSKNDRRAATPAIADPTPPEPMTRTFTRPQQSHVPSGSCNPDAAHFACPSPLGLTECGESGRNRLALRRIEAQLASVAERRGPVRGARRIDAVDQGIIEALQANGRGAVPADAGAPGGSG